MAFSGSTMRGSSKANSSMMQSSGMVSGFMSNYSTKKTTTRTRQSQNRRSRNGKGKDAKAWVEDDFGKNCTPVSLIEANEPETMKKPVNATFPEYEMDVEALRDISHASSDTDAGQESASEKESTMALSNRHMNQEEEKGEEVTEKEWSKEELEEPILVEIQETATFTLLHIPGVRLNNKDEESMVENKHQIEHYTKVRESHKVKDKFSNAHAQTFSLSHRNKQCNTDLKGYLNDIMPPPNTGVIGCQITTWDIHDSYAKDEEEDNVQDQDLALITGKDAHKEDEKVDDEGVAYPTGAQGDSESIYVLPAFRQALQVAEEAVIQNIIHPKHLLFRDHPQAVLETKHPTTAAAAEVDPLPSEDKKSEQPGAHLIPLWSFKCHLTFDMPVTCMCWNTKNKDLLAAGYGHTDFGNTSQGMILFWSLKNPTYPQKVIRTAHSVTSIDFCRQFSNLLAAGLYDGSVYIYDIREANDEPDLASQHITGKHSEPVWGLQWVAKENASQVLTSISTDGSVKQWSMKKGLVPHDIMMLKRIPNLAQLNGARMQGISREASGLCFDSPLTGPQYFVGTEDGLIHKCSTSYNEQTLENYYGHTGAVYKVRCSPFHPDAFISCSADWTCILWDQNRNLPILKLQHTQGQAAVMDLQWAPSNSCVFGCVTRDGRIEVWDLEYSPLDPIITHTTIFKQLTSVSFAPDSPVILAGGKDGTIDVYRTFGVKFADRNSDNFTTLQQDRLVGVLGHHKKIAMEEQKRKDDAAKADEVAPASRLDELLALLCKKEEKAEGMGNAGATGGLMSSPDEKKRRAGDEASSSLTLDTSSQSYGRTEQSDALPSPSQHTPSRGQGKSAHTPSMRNRRKTRKTGTGTNPKSRR